MSDSHIALERIQRSIQSRFDPLRNLTPARLVAQLDAFNAGYLGEAARTWDAMLRRDDRLAALCQKRLSAVARYGFDVVTVDTDDEGEKAQAEAHKERIEYFLNHLTATSAVDQNQRGGFSLLVRQMASAIGMRYSVHEIVWVPEADGLRAEFRHVPLWFFENRTGRLRFLAVDYGLDGIDMPEDEWLVAVGPGLMEASAVAWMYKRLPLRDWLAYSEKFGFPGVLGKTTAAPNSPEWRAMEDAVRAFANDFAAVCNQAEAIELIKADGAANLPFPALIERMDRALSILWRGGDLSTAAGSGSGDHTGASLQGEETDLIEQDDAAWLSEVLQTSVIRQVIAYHFGRGTRPLAYVQIRTRDRKNTKLDLEMFKTLKEIGVPLGVDMVLERFGLSRPSEEDEVIGATPKHEGGRMKDEGLANERLAEELGVPKGWISPVETLLAEIEAKAGTLTDEEYARYLREVQSRLPELLGDMDADELAAVMEAALGKAVLTGVRDQLRKQK